VPEFDDVNRRPTEEVAAKQVAVDAAKKAFWAKLESLDTVRDEFGNPYGDRLLSLVMLNVLDEKWKDHLYDLDQLRNAIHYRSWGQKDPLIEYKQEAYTMFVDLMNDIYNTFSERFLKVQLILEPPPPPPSMIGAFPPAPTGPKKRFNALGILEDIPEEEPQAEAPSGTDAAVDIGPAETPTPKPVAARKDPVIVGAGRTRSLNNNPPAGNTDWSTVGRNDPCPCGSGKKFKKCHGATL
jgi:preprotein translocase subunit SecA